MENQAALLEFQQTTFHNTICANIHIQTLFIRFQQINVNKRKDLPQQRTRIECHIIVGLSAVSYLQFVSLQIVTVNITSEQQFSCYYFLDISNYKLKIVFHTYDMVWYQCLCIMRHNEHTVHVRYECVHSIGKPSL